MKMLSIYRYLLLLPVLLLNIHYGYAQEEDPRPYLIEKLRFYYVEAPNDSSQKPFLHLYWNTAKQHVRTVVPLDDRTSYEDLGAIARTLDIYPAGTP